MLNPAGQIEVAGAYQAEHLAYAIITMFALFASVHLLGRFDESINKQLIGYFRARTPSPPELCEGEPLPLLYRHRKTIAQVLNWATYSVIAGFIVTQSFFISVNVGRDCEFARVNYHEQNFTCFVAHVQFSYIGGYLDGGAAEFDCNVGPPYEGYFCFRKVSESELDFYVVTNTMGILAALLAPYAFGVELGAFVIGGLFRILTYWIKDDRYRRLTFKAVVVVQFFILMPNLIMLLLLLFSDYLLRFETLSTSMMVYFMSSLTALLYQIDREEKERAEKLEITLDTNTSKDDL